MEKSQSDYQQLHDHSRHAQIISGISMLLEWDQETYMPADAGNVRGEQLKVLAGISHKERTGVKYTNALAKLVDIETGKIIATGLSAEQNAAIREWHRDYILETALPGQFVEEFAILTSQAQLAWRKAKNNNTFAEFAPFLEKILTMCRKKADLIGYQEHPYDALLDIYEPHMKTSELNKLFSTLKRGIRTLLKKIVNAPQVDDSFLHGSFDQKQQLAFGQLILDGMGYIPSRCRLDISEHPFSSSCHPCDNRITTRIHNSSLMSNISSLLHEGGHCLYEMGLPEEQYGSPLGQAVSLGIHESQSRWWETRIGKSLPFWKHYYPLLQHHFKGQLDHFPLMPFYRAINKVSPSLIRIEADEVTYPLHVIVRFEIEKLLIEGSLSIKELPEAWNSKIEEMLGISPKTYAEGCLQDIHWSMGSFGYFPTYALGNIYASQIFSAFEQHHPDWEVRVAAGDLLFIKVWLQRNIHHFGRQFSSEELIKKLSGSSISSDAYIDYLNKKYQDIYAF